MIDCEMSIFSLQFEYEETLEAGVHHMNLDDEEESELDVSDEESNDPGMGGYFMNVITASQYQLTTRKSEIPSIA